MASQEIFGASFDGIHDSFCCPMALHMMNAQRYAVHYFFYRGIPSFSGMVISIVTKSGLNFLYISQVSTRFALLPQLHSHS
jgi:hypothetical protein